MNNTIFVSYNPGIEIEQSLALRLQTISSLYDAKIYLPDRSGRTGLKDNTKQRINDSMVFVSFLTVEMSQEVIDEIKFALEKGKRVIVFDGTDSKELITDKNLIVIPFDHKKATTEELLGLLVKNNVFKNLEKDNRKNEDSENGSVILAIIAIGLGLLLLGFLLDDNKK